MDRPNVTQGQNARNLETEHLYSSTISQTNQLKIAIGCAVPKHLWYFLSCQIAITGE